jgi:hypothetical protein
MRAMSRENAISITNIVFLLGGIYFVLVGLLGEATIYSIVPGALCFIAIALSLRDGIYFAGPWRVATCVSVLALLGGQEFSSLNGFSFSNYYTVGTVVLNGALFILFCGLLLSTGREITKKKQEEEEEIAE